MTVRQAAAAGAIVAFAAMIAGCGSTQSRKAEGVDIADAAQDPENMVDAYGRGRGRPSRSASSPVPASRPARAVAREAIPAVAMAGYRCADGGIVAARFDNRANTVTLDPGRGEKDVTLAGQRVASGIRYASEGWELRAKGREAMLTRPDRDPVSCRAQD